MKKQTCRYKVVGVMSGTSLDGLDLCLTDFNYKENKWHYKILKTKTVAYDSNLTKTLCNAQNLSGLELNFLSNKFGNFIGKEINKFTDSSSYDFISSHGHTIFHQPEKHLTLQIGNGAFISEITGKTCVCDFRSLDVALGGQGAPLVPRGDQLLFSEFDACLNIGGFANISHFNTEKKIIAFDICPVNTVLNKYSNLLGRKYDDKGEIAKNNSVDNLLLQKLNSLPYYSTKPPKSLGIEWVEKQIFPLMESSNISPEVKISTFTAHVAYQITKTLKEMNINNLLVTGGGAFNSYLIDSIDSKSITLGNEKLIEYKEAIIFAFLGVLRLRNEVNVLSSVTGAKSDSISGQVFLV